MNNMMWIMQATAEAGAEVAEGAGMISLLGTLVPLVGLFVVMYFMMIRPQRKKEKEVQAMRSNLEVGDEIVTSGGVIGRVVNIQEDNVVVETGSDRSKIRIARWAVQQNNTVHDDTPSS